MPPPSGGTGGGLGGCWRAGGCGRRLRAARSPRRPWPERPLPAHGGAPVTMPPPTPPVTAPMPPPASPGPSPMSVALYDESKVIDLFLTFPPGRVGKAAQRAGWSRTTRAGSAARFTFEGESFPEAHCRRKGTPEIWDIEKKPQIIVRFNFVNKQGRFRGLRRLNLEFFDGTDAPIRDRLGMWLMREAGLRRPPGQPRPRLQGRAAAGPLHEHRGRRQGVPRRPLRHRRQRRQPVGERLGAQDQRGDAQRPPRLESLNDLVEREPLNGDHTAFYAAARRAGGHRPDPARAGGGDRRPHRRQLLERGGRTSSITSTPRRGFLVLPWDLDTIYSAPTDADLFAFWEPRPEQAAPAHQPEPRLAAPVRRTSWSTSATGCSPRWPAKAKAICDQVAPYVAADPNRRATYPTSWRSAPFFRR